MKLANFVSQANSLPHIQSNLNTKLILSLMRNVFLKCEFCSKSGNGYVIEDSAEILNLLNSDISEKLNTKDKQIKETIFTERFYVEFDNKIKKITNNIVIRIGENHYIFEPSYGQKISVNTKTLIFLDNKWQEDVNQIKFDAMNRCSSNFHNQPERIESKDSKTIKEDKNSAKEDVDNLIETLNKTKNNPSNSAGTNDALDKSTAVKEDVGSEKKDLDNLNRINEAKLISMIKELQEKLVTYENTINSQANKLKSYDDILLEIKKEHTESIKNFLDENLQRAQKSIDTFIEKLCKANENLNVSSMEIKKYNSDTHIMITLKLDEFEKGAFIVDPQDIRGLNVGINLITRELNTRNDGRKIEIRLWNTKSQYDLLNYKCHSLSVFDLIKTQITFHTFLGIDIKANDYVSYIKTKTQTDHRKNDMGEYIKLEDGKVINFRSKNLGTNNYTPCKLTIMEFENYLEIW